VILKVGWCWNGTSEQAAERAGGALACILCAFSGKTLQPKYTALTD